MKNNARHLYQRLPETPGVYLMRGTGKKLLYIGKAGNLRRRVSSYFLRPADARIEKLVSQIRNIDVKETRTALEALMLEANLIKQYAPPFNIREKDDKSFLFVEVTDEEWPRVLLVRGRMHSSDVKEKHGERFGPFVSASSIREALRILRRIFPWSTHSPEVVGAASRPCFNAEVGLCPGVCVGKADKREYRRNIRNLKKVFSGGTQDLLRRLTRNMKQAADRLDFERAAQFRRQISALEHVQDVALLDEPTFSERGERKKRIEGFDISNISGTGAVGAMVVFQGDNPDKKSYRRFRIKTIQGQNDVGMMEEVLRRRFRRKSGEAWPLPHCILVDGGSQQVAIANQVLEESGLRIPVVGIAKGPKRRKNEFFGSVPEGISEKTLIRVRNEAHRFAVNYHRKIRDKMQ